MLLIHVYFQSILVYALVAKTIATETAQFMICLTGWYKALVIFWRGRRTLRQMVVNIHALFLPFWKKNRFLWLGNFRYKTCYFCHFKVPCHTMTPSICLFSFVNYYSINYFQVEARDNTPPITHKDTPPPQVHHPTYTRTERQDCYMNMNAKVRNKYSDFPLAVTDEPSRQFREN